MAEEKPKILRRLLVLVDSPTVATGFGVLAKNMLFQIWRTGDYLIDVIGINFRGDFYDTVQFPYRIYPAVAPHSQDMFGRPRLLAALSGRDYALRGPWDLVLTINDHFIIENVAEALKTLQKQLKEQGFPETQFKWIGYWPVDSSLRQNWVDKAVALSDYPIAYTNYAKEEILKWDANGELEKRLKVIYHGVNTKDFYPLSEEEKAKFRQNYFGNKIKPSTFIITNVSRNQYRKDLMRTMKIYSEFRKRHPDSLLYIHAKIQDAGGSLEEMARTFGLKDNEWSTPVNFDENIGFPTEVLNGIYNASDVTLSTTLGEGWGFMFTESMATNTLTMAPYNTSLKEILGSETLDDKVRGIPLKNNTTSSEWFSGGIIDNERIRPLTNVDDAVEKLTWVYENPEKAKIISQRGYDWVKTLTWEEIGKKWVEVLNQAYTDLEKEREIRKIALNDLKAKQALAGLRK